MLSLWKLDFSCINQLNGRGKLQTWIRAFMYFFAVTSFNSQWVLSKVYPTFKVNKFSLQVQRLCRLVVLGQMMLKSIQIFEVFGLFLDCSCWFLSVFLSLKTWLRKRGLRYMNNNPSSTSYLQPTISKMLCFWVAHSRHESHTHCSVGSKM